MFFYKLASSLRSSPSWGVHPPDPRMSLWVKFAAGSTGFWVKLVVKLYLATFAFGTKNICSIRNGQTAIVRILLSVKIPLEFSKNMT